ADAFDDAGEHQRTSVVEANRKIGREMQRVFMNVSRGWRAKNATRQTGARTAGPRAGRLLSSGL
ncbi:MAG: hypothetical protein J0H45_06060, partial [Stenotrophomonas nitritireducens]|nr:hypothetical protein [Stenotrophomonas nitritireducens]